MSRHASPGAQLLRNSRFFSLPQPLPRPNMEQPLMDRSYRLSESASTPYPLRQAIMTTKSSAARGDFGLKRRLPKKATSKSSEPVHIVVANDTYEGVTEYYSASNHTKTLERFQELNLGLSRADTRHPKFDKVPLSAMDQDYDYTDAKTTPLPDARNQSRRWKYKNSRVGKLTPAAFEEFLQSKVSNKRDPFMLQLRARACRQQLADRLKEMKADVQSGEKEILGMQLDVMSGYTKWVHELSIEELLEYLEGEHRTTASPLSYYSSLCLAIQPYWSLKFPTPPTTAPMDSEAPRVEELDAPTKAKFDMLESRIKTQAEFARLSASRPGHIYFGTGQHRAWLDYFAAVDKLETSFAEGWRTKTWDPSDIYFHSYLVDLRADTTLSSRLNTYIRAFMDMPTFNPNNRIGSEISTPNLTTHPTAGLSYLRTNNILPNHPILGPQANPPPVKARLIGQARNMGRLWGMAGFVANPQPGGANDMDFTTPGGLKQNRFVQRVFVDGEARIRIESKQSISNEARGVRDGQLTRSEPASDYGNIGHLAAGQAGAYNSFRSSPSLPIGLNMAPRAAPLNDAGVEELKRIGEKIERMRKLREGDAGTGEPASELGRGLPRVGTSAL